MLEPIPTIAEARNVQKNLASSFGMNKNPDPGFGGFQPWVQSCLVQVSYDPILILIGKIPLSLTAMQLSFIINQTGRLPWCCDRVRRHCGPHHFTLTTMLVHRCDSPHGVELTCGPRAKNISRIYFSATVNQRLVQ